jgi:AsmA family
MISSEIPMKPLRRTLAVLAAVVVVVGLVAYLAIDAIVKSAVEKESSKSLKLTTTLSSAHLAMLRGKLSLNDLRIASPKGFSAPHMLELGKTDLAVRYSQLREDPIHVKSLTVYQPTLVLEQSNGVVNFKKAADGMPPSSSSAKPVKLIIDELRAQEAEVIIRPGLPGVRQQITVSVPSIALKDVGRGAGSQNGAAIKDIAMVLVGALAGRAADSGSVPAELKALLHLSVAQMAGQLGPEAQKQIAAAVPGELGKRLSSIAANPSTVTKDAGNLLQGEVGGILGAKKSDTAQPAASGRAPPRTR